MLNKTVVDDILFSIIIIFSEKIRLGIPCKSYADDSYEMPSLIFVLKKKIPEKKISSASVLIHTLKVEISLERN